MVVDASMYEDSQARLRDLRLFQEGKEVPFVLKTSYGSSQEEQRTASLMDKAIIPGVGVQFILEPRAGASHNQVSIETTQIDFKQQVRVETSDDRRHWDVVRRDGIIFNVSSADTRAAGLSVSYPISKRRYVRVTIRGWRDLSWVRSASISFVRTIAAQRHLVANLKPVAVEDEKEHVTNLSFDLGFARPYDRITLAPGPGWFSRLAEVSTSTDGKTWSVAGFATLLRSASKEELTLEFPEKWDRQIRVEIHNNDNAPLLIRGAQWRGLRARP